MHVNLFCAAFGATRDAGNGLDELLLTPFFFLTFCLIWKFLKKVLDLGRRAWKYHRFDANCICDFGRLWDFSFFFFVPLLLLFFIEDFVARGKWASWFHFCSGCWADGLRSQNYCGLKDPSPSIYEYCTLFVRGKKTCHLLTGIFFVGSLLVTWSSRENPILLFSPWDCPSTHIAFLKVLWLVFIWTKKGRFLQILTLTISIEESLKKCNKRKKITTWPDCWSRLKRDWNKCCIQIKRWTLKLYLLAHKASSSRNSPAPINICLPNLTLWVCLVCLVLDEAI